MKLIVVANRLPFQISETEGKSRVKQSTGGVATGIHSYINARTKDTPDFSFKWAGWPGEIPENKFSLFVDTFGDSYIPIPLSSVQMEKFYDGFCNKTLWPLFHSFPMLTEYDDEYWRLYIEVNIQYCNKVAEVVEPGDTIFINDYHLMLLPRLLRDIFPDTRICFFLHIPFPDFEIFRQLPGKWRLDILDGILAADVAGFHTHEYREHFLHCVRRILGLEHVLGEIPVHDRLCKAETFPMGIDFDLYAAPAAVSEDSAMRSHQPAEVTGNGMRRILSLDRLDYTKGILNRLRGFEYFLKKYPEMQGRVQLHVIAVPSRVGVDKYQDLKNQLDELIGGLNGSFSRADWLPVFYQFTNLNTREVIALYRDCDIALVTPLRDGMNLIAKEYLAARNDDTGVLILSEMAGAAGELPGAIIINPNSLSEIAEAIKNALEITRDEQITRNRPMRHYLRGQSIHMWMHEIMECLDVAHSKEIIERRRHLSGEVAAIVRHEFQRAANKILFLDYDGTLVPFTSDPQDAVPDGELHDLLSQLAESPNTEVYIISGRNRGFLASHFSSKKFGIVAEHGAFVRLSGETEWKPLLQAGTDWFTNVMPILQKYHDRMYGSSIEQKEKSIVFHYRNASGEPGFIRERAYELYDTLLQFTANINVEVIQGNFNVEVRNNGVSKGTAVMTLMRVTEHDFILCIGDDTTDEDMFRILPQKSYPVKVGRSKTAARYYLKDPGEVRSFLSSFTSPVNAAAV